MRETGGRAAKEKPIKAMQLTPLRAISKENLKVELQPKSQPAGLEFTLQRAEAKGIACNQNDDDERNPGVEWRRDDALSRWRHS
jgi:hypothetical protein